MNRMEKGYFMLGALIVLAIVALMMLVFLASARADGLPRGLGHDQETHSWVGTQCCLNEYCEPLEHGAVTIDPVNGRYRVHYRSARGHEVMAIVEEQSVRMSKDRLGRNVACSLPAPPAQNRQQGISGTKGVFRCLFVIWRST